MEKENKKVKKNKVRLQSLAAAVIVAGSLTGCEKDKPTPVEQYINNSIVITTDTGKKYIVRKIDQEQITERLNAKHTHYYDVVTKEYYSDLETCNAFIYKRKGIRPLYVNVSITENLVDYLTAEEYTKIMKDELSIDDCAEIIARIKESEIKEVKTKQS